nr:SDR family NAD(P)-dependent oxidoreductase [Streptomyces oceani]
MGVAGRYPGASNVREFWRNLAAGEDCVTEIPADRWDHARYYDPDRNAAGKTYAKWGGFLDGADRFDALFFNISPREAEFMDPQERLFLECVQETLQDAGYTRSELSRYGADGFEGNVGVFAGVMYEEYQLYGAQEQARGRNVALSGNPSSIANRASYFFNLHGPSMAVDTMCSSSLTALHLACQSLLNAECEVAVAGGVNLSLHPNKFLMLGSGKWASSRGLCESFGAEGDGYVPGEGVGAVLLKPLDRAEADGDTIYGVIRGTAVNHGGKTNGYSVPNPRAQSAVIGRALREAGVDARDVSYVEAHGTGTSLGDPIEVAGLTQAFSNDTQDTRFCAIGSVKSNIGHAESAAGIAGLTKVLLQMKHGTLVPSLHSEVLNPNIDFASGPFQVQRTLGEWVRPRTADGLESPRIAGVSSFGAGGSNAHVIVAEHLPQRVVPDAGDEPDTEVAIVLSARTEAGLRDQAEQLVDWLGQDGSTEPLPDIAYTLQTGRDAFEERLGVVVATTGELTGALRGFLAAEEVPGLYRGKVKRRGPDSNLRVFAVDEDMARAVSAWIEKRKYGKLLELWTAGLAVDWAKLHRPHTRRRISLPTYPFQRERYWPSLSEDREPLPGAGRLHPLVHTNTSSLAGQRFTSVFTGDEFFLRDHQVGGERLLSGAACLELVRAAVAESLDGEPHGTVRLTNVAWSRPVIVRERPETVHVRLRPDGGEEIGFEILSHPDPDAEAPPVIHSQGTVLVPPAAAGGTSGTTVDLAELRSRCRDTELGADEVYGAFAAHGIAYGPGHRGIQRLWAGDGQVVARLVLPEAVEGSLDSYGLHPSLLDSAVQAALGVTAGDDGTPHLPYAVDELEVTGTCSRTMWAWVRSTAHQQRDAAVRRLDIELCDDDGTVAVRIRGLSLRAYSAERAGEFLAVPRWSGEERRGGVREGTPAAVTVVAGLPAVAEALESRGGARVVRLESDAPDVDGRFSDHALRLFGVVREVLAERAHHGVCVQVVVPADGESSVWSGLAGVVRTAGLENPRVTGQVVLVESWEDARRVAAWVEAERAASEDAVVRYRVGDREVLRWRELSGTTDRGVDVPWRDDGVYLITGGAGGVGALFAGDIAERARGARIVLTGRGALDEDRGAVLAALRAAGAEASYERVDVADRVQTVALVSRIRAEYGRLDGVLHSAGVIRDSFVLKKTEEDLSAVLAPKVTGAVNLDEATRDVDLDFLVFFSSVAGVSGNVGQADYAAANAFMDAFAGHRNTLVARGERRGRTLSVNWPLWAEGGMSVDAATERSLREDFGMVPLRTRTGISALHRALATDEDQVMVLEGDTERLAALVGAPSDGRGPESDSAGERTAAGDAPVAPGGGERTAHEHVGSTSDPAEQDIGPAAVAYFTRLLSSVIDLPAARIDPEASLEDYGVDSVMTMDLTRALEEVFGSLSKTLFFEYQSIEALAGHFVTAHPDRVRELVAAPSGGRTRVDAANEPATRTTAPEGTRDWRNRGDRRNRGGRTGVEVTAADTSKPVDIAITGLAGRYPQARDVHEFWRNLAGGQDCVTEIPGERWDHDRYFSEDRQAEGRTYGKWGGFVDGAYEFDPLFFNISPREAEIMSPQERLFLQCVYETLEDAGYVRESAKTRTGNVLTGRVGVFVGVMYEEYQLHGAQSQVLGGDSLAVSGSSAGIANRVSYFCNLHGPSMSVDTMCSSSLTSLHLACQSIRWGDCEAAVAGGVNLSLHPNKYLLLSTGNFLSGSGRCQSFGADGDGYTPGEGVGAVLLKPLAKAVADGDRIYGVIKGTALNHGGKTNGYTVPNPNAQAGTIDEALSAAGVDPRSVSYVEAHGTGTQLGDPIEITGLSKAFREHTQDDQFCAIGSVKSNIGHAESAAGIAGLTKVLLQLRHRRLVPSLHAEPPNPNIDFASTPFRVQSELADWRAPDPETPRIAGISSFGAGGSNAHVIVSEYLPEPAEPAPATAGPAVVPLSARTAEELRDVARNLAEWLDRPENVHLDLADVAYTLQVGREPMRERLGILATSAPDLVEKLHHVLSETVTEDVVRGGSTDENTVSALFSQDADLDALVTAWIEKGKYDKLLELWVNDVAVDWRRLYPGGVTPRRVGLPTYPFARERYCPFDDQEVEAAGPRVLHPLVHENTSDLEEQRFTSVFTGREPFLRDHVVGGAKLMPGAALLEMVVAATSLTCRTRAEPTAPVALKNVILAQPLRVDGKPYEVHVGLRPQPDGDIGFRISGTADESAEPVPHAEGAVYLAEEAAEEVLDLPSLRDACDRAELTAEQCYRTYGAAGITYGPAHQGVRHVWIGRDQALAHLALPTPVHGTLGDYTLHPSLLDAALQASVGVLGSLGERRDDAALLVPFAVDDVLVLDSGAAAMWALVRPSAERSGDTAVHKLDVDLADDQGRVRVRIGGLSLRALDESAGHGDAAHRTEEQPGPRGLLRPEWRARPVTNVLPEDDDVRRTVLLVEMPEVAASLSEQDRAVVLTSGDKDLDRRYTAYGLQALEHLRSVLRGVSAGRAGIQLVIGGGSESAPLSGLVGLLRTATMENPNVSTQVLLLEDTDQPETVVERVRENRAHPDDTIVRYVGARREVPVWFEDGDGAAGVPPVPWREDGVYLLTGGTGALGLVFAREIATRTHSATLVLTGRSPEGPRVREALRDLRSQGAVAHYVQADVSDGAEVDAVVDALVEEHGRIDGVIHAAGVTRDGLILTKRAEEFVDVLAPKVSGVVNLDRATSTLPLDFFVAFSSTTGAFGNVGQADYAAANAFMDAYAWYRQDLVARGERSGRSLSVNWPLWEDGGMGVSPEVRSTLRSRYGVVPLETAAGVTAFHRMVTSTHSQVMVAPGLGPTGAGDPGSSAPYQSSPLSSAIGTNQ